MTLESPTAPAREIEATSVHSVKEWSALVPAWEQVLDEADHSIFLSIPWMETWLEIFGDAVDPEMLAVRAGDRVVAAGILAKSGPCLSRPLRRLSFNASGENIADSTYVEFNDVPARPGWERHAGEALAKYALGQPWQELTLDGFRPGPAYESIKSALTEMQLEEVRKPSYFVDLARLRAGGSRYLSALGSRHRKHLQQNLRYHAERGEVALQAAPSTAAALDMFEEMAALNRRRRETKGQPSVFTSERFTAFHRSFIRKTFPLGRVQLLRTLAGSATIGLIYNLVYKGKVYFYQCGFNYAADRRLSPGMVSLSLVIQYCLDEGFLEFDFLAGAAPYKAAMSTGSRPLIWATFRRPGARVWAYGIARDLKNRFRSQPRSTQA